jgi:3-hydroxyisobutyrate dehydrogenase
MRTGFIGLGAMGSRMAANLARAGHLEVVWNRTPGRAQALAADLGVPVARDLPELAARSDLIVTCVSRDGDLLEVVRALDAGLSPGKAVVDTSTVSATTARQLATQLAAVGVGFLDAPVSGGVEGAARGTLVMMVGGDETLLDRVRAVLGAVAARIVHLGPAGSGQATKAVNQVMAAGINQAVTEALGFGAALGLPMDRVLEVVGGGAAGSWFLTHRGAALVRGEFPPGFKVALHHKDLAICRGMAEAAGGVTLPLVERTLADYERLILQGHGDEDISALYRLKRPKPTQD